jgi:branched-chain amino acid transport system substrate-binding protein
LEEHGQHIVFYEGYDPAATDFRSALAKLKQLKADAVFMPGYLEMATILKQAKELGINAQFYSSFPFENTTILDIAGRAAEGVIYPFFFDSDSTNPIMIAYQQKYQKRYGRPSEGFAALAYFGMSLIVDTMRKVGPDADRIKEALYRVKSYPTGFGPVSFDDKGDIDIPILIKTVQDGKFIVYSAAGPRPRAHQSQRRGADFSRSRTWHKITP